MKKQRAGLKAFHLPFISGVEFISGKHISNEFRRHIHQTFIIGLITQGERIISFPGGTKKIPMNDMFIINPGQVHSCGSETEHSYSILSVSPHIMRSIASHISEKNEKEPYFRQNHYHDTILCSKIIALFEAISIPESDIQVESDFYSFLTFLILNFSACPPEIHDAGEQRVSIKRVCDYICHHYSENLSLKKLADIACLSPFHFQREFKACLGITPNEYLNDLRISKAKEMILNSEKLCDIAIQVGFFDQSHFSKIFRKSVGVSPGKYLAINKRQ